MSLYPVRSISQLPTLYVGDKNYQGYTKDFEHLDNDLSVKNYQAYGFSTDSNIEKEYRWITDIPDGRLLIETSLSTGNGQYVARQFDFGNFLRYIGESLQILESRSYKTYLTEERANKLYLPLGGGTLSGALIIDPKQGGQQAGASLVIQSTYTGAPNAIKIFNKQNVPVTTISANSIDVRGSITCQNLTADVKLSCSTLEAADHVTSRNLTATSDFDFAEIITKDNDFAKITKLKSGEISVNGTMGTGTTTTDYLVVNENTTFNKDVTVGQDLIVKQDISALTNNPGYHVFLKGVHVLGNQVLSVDAGVSTNGTITGNIINGMTKIQIGDSDAPAVYATSDGFTCTSKFCNLTAQYACWA